MLFFAYQAVVARSGMLIHFSFEKRSFQSWLDDAGMKSHVEAALPPEWIAQLHQQQNYTLYHIIDALKEAFLVEAEKQRMTLRKA